MKRKNINKPSSLIEAFNVRPRICSPFECLESLKILNTLTNRITLRMARDIAWLLPFPFGATASFGAITSSFSATIVARVIKYGIIATKSIMFMMSLANTYLLGHERKRTNNSNVNQMMQSVSTMKKGSVTSGTSSSSIFVPLAVVLNTYWNKIRRNNDGIETIWELHSFCRKINLK